MDPEKGDVSDIVEELRAVGPRPPLDSTALERLHAPALEAWRTLVKKETLDEETVEEEAVEQEGAGQEAACRPASPRHLQRWSWIAALLVVGLGLGWWQLEKDSLELDRPAVARIEALRGQPLSPAGVGLGGRLGVGDVVESGQARLALRLVAGQDQGGNSGHGLRIDRGSRLIVLDEDRIRLEAGGLYVEASDGPLVVETPWGLVRHVGTLYEVRLAPGAVESSADMSGAGTSGEVTPLLRVRVREGKVNVETGDDSATATGGQELRLEERASSQGEDGSSGQELVLASIDTHGEDWAWVVDSAPSLAIDGRPLREVVAALVAELGWTLETTGAPFELEDGSPIVVRGAASGLDPEEVLEMVLEGAGLEYQLDAVDGRASIEGAGGSRGPG